MESPRLSSASSESMVSEASAFYVTINPAPDNPAPDNRQERRPLIATGGNTERNHRIRQILFQIFAWSVLAVDLADICIIFSGQLNDAGPVLTWLVIGSFLAINIPAVVLVSVKCCCGNTRCCGEEI